MRKYKWTKVENKLKRIIKAILLPIIDNITYTIKYGDTNIRLKGGFYFLHDIGSHIGILTIFFAKSSREVVAFEPNQETFLKLKKNVRLNGIYNVEFLNIAIGSRRETKTLIMPKFFPGSGSLGKK